MQEYVSTLRSGDILDAKVTHPDQFGCFVDIGCGISSLIPIYAISVSRIAHASDRFLPGMDIKAVVSGRDDAGRLVLSHKELLGTWQQNADCFTPGETVSGVVRSVESYGIFIELAPNLAGLAELREGVRPGQQASVYIKSMNREKMKIKLALVDCFDDRKQVKEPHYFITQGHLSRWDYAPPGACKQMTSIFDTEEDDSL